MSDRSDAVAAWESLYRAQVAVLRHIKTELHDGLSGSEYDVLLTLWQAPGRAARIRDLNDCLLVSQPSVSRIIDRLAARGLVSKCGDPADARGTVTTLTEDGVRFFRRVAAEHARIIADRMLTTLSPDDVRELGRLTEALRGGAAPSSSSISQVAERDTMARAAASAS